MYYQSPHQTPEDDLVDERWENNLVFHPSTSSLKEQPIKTAFNNLKISYNGGSKQVNLINSYLQSRVSMLNVIIRLLLLKSLVRNNMDIMA